MAFIYVIHNITSGKRYIGSTTRPKKRWNEHRSLLRRNKHPNYKLQGSWNKHGEASFVLESAESNIPEYSLSEREDFWISSFDSVKNGYNIRITAETNRGYKHSDKTKKKISDSLKKNGHKPNKDAIKKSILQSKGKPKPPHVVKALSDANKKLWLERGDEMRSKCRNLSDKEVKEIKSAILKEKTILNGKRFRKNGLRYSELGKKYGVSAATICLIEKGKRYAEIN
jgi:group I intron endonuclease